MNLSCFQALKLIRQAPSGPGTDHPLSRKKRPGQRRVIRIELPGGGGGRGGRKGADVVREGEGEDEDEDEMREFEERIEKAGLPEHALKAAQKELKVQYIIYIYMYVHCIYMYMLLYNAVQYIPLLEWQKLVSATIQNIFFPFLLSIAAEEFACTVSRTCRLKVHHSRTSFCYVSIPSFRCSVILRNYLETLLDLPWSRSTTDSLDLPSARLTLDTDHYGLKPVRTHIHVLNER